MVTDIKLAQNGFVVYLKDKVIEAVKLFQSIQDKTPVFFTDEKLPVLLIEKKPTFIKKLWSKINAYIKSHTS